MTTKPKSVLAWAASENDWIYLQSIRHAQESVVDWVGSFRGMKIVPVRITVVRERKRKQAKKTTKRRAKR